MHKKLATALAAAMALSALQFMFFGDGPVKGRPVKITASGHFPSFAHARMPGEQAKSRELAD